MRVKTHYLATQKIHFWYLLSLPLIISSLSKTCLGRIFKKYCLRYAELFKKVNYDKTHQRSPMYTHHPLFFSIVIVHSQTKEIDWNKTTKHIADLTQMLLFLCVLIFCLFIIPCHLMPCIEL